MTLDEYRKQREVEKKVNQSVLLKFKTQDTGKAQNLNAWKNLGQTYSRVNNDEESEDEDEETECEENLEKEKLKNNKSLSSIPLIFKPFECELPRGLGNDSTIIRDSGDSRQAFGHSGDNRRTFPKSNQDSRSTGQ
ncbi:unnamed protein product [Rotaria sp. Silwood2]|nr:unnamed protein product [Rotaria sp. Silwood2]CAF4510180.1 unnamed protein product [Rotaria sp. Silwood2]